MINSKAELKRRINDIQYIETLETDVHTEDIGIQRTVKHTQGNAFTLNSWRNGQYVESWMWYKDFTVKDNIITFKNSNIKLLIVE